MLFPYRPSLSLVSVLVLTQNFNVFYSNCYTVRIRRPDAVDVELCSLELVSVGFISCSGILLLLCISYSFEIVLFIRLCIDDSPYNLRESKMFTRRCSLEVIELPVRVVHSSVEGETLMYISVTRLVDLVYHDNQHTSSEYTCMQVHDTFSRHRKSQKFKVRG